MILAKKINNENCIVSGNPIRSEIIEIEKNKAREILGFDKEKKLLLIIGGSQGAKPINNHFLKNIHFYIKNNYQIIWQCGNFDFEYLKTKIKNNNIVIEKFIDNMSYAYSASDIVISRAGAIAISEMTFMGKAMILIPFPQAAENHQYINAKTIESKEAGILIEQHNLSKGILEDKIKDIFYNLDYLKSLEKKSKKISQPKATNTIVDTIVNMVIC